MDNILENKNTKKENGNLFYEVNNFLHNLFYNKKELYK